MADLFYQNNTWNTVLDSTDTIILNNKNAYMNGDIKAKISNLPICKIDELSPEDFKSYTGHYRDEIVNDTKQVTLIEEEQKELTLNTNSSFCNKNIQISSRSIVREKAQPLIDRFNNLPTPAQINELWTSDATYSGQREKMTDDFFIPMQMTQEKLIALEEKYQIITTSILNTKDYSQFWTFEDIRNKSYSSSGDYGCLYYNSGTTAKTIGSLTSYKNFNYWYVAIIDGNSYTRIDAGSTYNYGYSVTNIYTARDDSDKTTISVPAKHFIICWHDSGLPKKGLHIGAIIKLPKLIGRITTGERLTIPFYTPVDYKDDLHPESINDFISSLITPSDTYITAKIIYRLNNYSENKQPTFTLGTFIQNNDNEWIWDDSFKQRYDIIENCTTSVHRSFYLNSSIIAPTTTEGKFVRTFERDKDNNRAIIITDTYVPNN